MAIEHVCPICHRTFLGAPTRKVCSMACRNRMPNRISPEGREKLRAQASGDNAPARKPGVAAKIREANIRGGHFDGRKRPNFKGEIIIKSRWGDRALVWIAPEERVALGIKGPHIRRAHLVWLRAHPGETIKRGEVIHHKNQDSLDDRPENLEKFPNVSTHTLAHMQLIRANGGHRDRAPDRPCETCGAPIRRRRFCSIKCAAIGQSGEGNPHFGHAHTEDVKNAQSARMAGRKATAETRERMRQSHLKRWAVKRGELTP